MVDLILAFDITAAAIACAGVVVLALTLTRMLERRRVRRQFAEIDATLSAFEQGNRSARIAYVGGSGFAEVSSRINATMDRMSAYIRAQELAAAQIAHELRSPTARLLAKLQAASSKGGICAGDLPELEQLVEYNLQIFDGVTAVIRVEQASLAFRRVRLDEILTEVIALFGEVAEDSGVEIRSTLVGARIDGDRNLLSRLFVNLVDNAIKYSYAGGTVHVAVSDLGPEVQVTIDDAGPGMKNMPQHIGSFLERGPDTAGIDGLGLGLALCTRVIARHGGTITFADRDPPLGLRVTLRFPSPAV